MTRTYEVKPAHPRKKCEECGASLALVSSPSGKVVPVNIATRHSHFEDCPNPARVSRETKMRAAREAHAGAARHDPPSQRTLFE